MKFSLRKAVGAILFAAAAAGASAQVVNYTPPGAVGGTAPAIGANGTLEIAVWDTLTSQSIVETLGTAIGSSGTTASDVSIPDMVTTNPTGGIQINFGQIGLSGGTNYFTQTFANALNGTNGDSISNLEWAVFALGQPQSNRSSAIATLFTTLADPSALLGGTGLAGAGVSGTINQTNVSFLSNNLTGLPVSHEVSAGLYVADNTQFPTSQNGSYAPQGNEFGGEFPAGSSNAATLTPTGSTLNFYEVSGAGNAAQAGTATVNAFSNGVAGDTRQGSFTLSGTGQLTYLFPAGSQQAVPLPAAVWLLLSGLFGLGAVGRRRALSGEAVA